jgi:hypothetical protein
VYYQVISPVFDLQNYLVINVFVRGAPKIYNTELLLMFICCSSSLKMGVTGCYETLTVA